MRKQKGYILVQALVAIVGLVALMVMLANDQKSFTDTQQSRLRLRRADQAAQAAVARAMAAVATATPSEVTLNDTWAQQGSSGNEQFQFADGTASYRMEILDAGSLINLNTATAAQLEELPLTTSQVDSLLDWVQTGETARDDGAKDDFYNGLNTPYNAKLGPLTTVDEVLLVQGWTPSTIYQAPQTQSTLTMPTDQNGNVLPLANLFTVQSEAPSASSTGGTLIDLSQRSPNKMQQLQGLGIGANTAQAIAGMTPITTFGQLANVNGMTRQDMTNLLNGATVTAGTTVSGKLNLNTVSNTVLQTLTNVPTTLDADIVSQQSTGFTQLGDLGNISGITTAQMAQMADSFTVGSDTWIVHAYGESGGVGEAVEATIRLTSGTPRLLSEQRLSTAQPPTWWGWSTQTPTTQDSGAAQ